MPSIQSTWWLFTLNSKIETQSLGDLPEDLPTVEVLQEFFSKKDSYIQFVCWSHEFATRHHLQGCIQMKSKSSNMLRVKSCFPEQYDHIHLEPVRSFGAGDTRGPDKVVDDVISYCSKVTGDKEGSIQVSGPHIYGERLKKGSNKRKLSERCQQSPERMSLEKPHDYRRWYSNQCVRKFKDEFKFDFELNSWQKELERILSNPPDSRSIIWVYGPSGHEGKSTYAKKLHAEGWFYTRGGKTENLYYSYGPNINSNIVFDYPRSSEDVVQYAAIETVKDGMIESSKYEPLSFRRIGEVHVVVMANFLPKFKPERKREWNMETKEYEYSFKENKSLSEDRVKIIWCNPADYYKYQHKGVLLPVKRDYDPTGLCIEEGEIVSFQEGKGYYEVGYKEDGITRYKRYDSEKHFRSQEGFDSEEEDQ